MANIKRYFNHNNPTSNEVLTAIMVLSLTQTTDRIVESLRTCDPYDFLGAIATLMVSKWDIDIEDEYEVSEFVERAIDYIKETELKLKVSTNGHYPKYQRRG